MTKVSSGDEERYDRLAAKEESAPGVPTGGESRFGDEAAEIGHQMLLDALGSEAAVAKAVRGGRPNLEGRSGSGESSPQIRVRVTAARKRQLEELTAQMNRAHTSDIVREAIDEYVTKHLKAS